MAESNLGCQVWAIATYLLATGLKGQSSMKLHRDLGISATSMSSLDDTTSVPSIPSHR